MSENKHFDKALSDMKDNFAGRGGIAHLADLGYPVLKIQSSLDYPFPLDKIGRVMWDHFVSNETILLKAPGSGVGRENATYVRKTDAYGRQSFIRTENADPEKKETTWTKTVLRIDHDIFHVRPGEDEKIVKKFLAENSHGGPDYVSLDFGRLKERNGAEWMMLLSLLKGDERDYVSIMPWENSITSIYHRIDDRIVRMLNMLEGTSMMPGVFYFASGDV